MKYIATLSGGKDSTVMCDLLLSNGYPVDYILFNDTTAEYPEMYAYIEKLKEYFMRKHKMEITITQPSKTFEQGLLSKVFRSKKEYRNGQYVGIPVASGEAMCHLRKTLKINPTDKWIRKNIGKEPYKIYIGYTMDEMNRAKPNDTNIYPLIEYFKMSENDCRKYLADNEMENTLYRHFGRTGCALCPFKSETDWYNTYKYHRDIFYRGIEIEEKLSKNRDYKFFHKHKPLKEHAKIFDISQEFDFGTEPLRDCFCKI